MVLLIVKMEAIGMWDIFNGTQVPLSQHDVAHFNKYKKCDMFAFSSICEHVAQVVVQRLKLFANVVRCAQSVGILGGHIHVQQRRG